MAITHRNPLPDVPFPGLDKPTVFSDERIVGLIELLTHPKECICKSLGGNCDVTLRAENIFAFAHPSDERRGEYVVGCRPHIETTGKGLGLYYFSGPFGLNQLIEEKSRRDEIAARKRAYRELVASIVEKKRNALTERIALTVAIRTNKTIQDITPEQINGAMAAMGENLTRMRADIDREFPIPSEHNFFAEYSKPQGKSAVAQTGVKNGATHANSQLVASTTRPSDQPLNGITMPAELVAMAASATSPETPTSGQ